MEISSNELMVFKAGLRYASSSFLTHQPSGPDYSGRSGVQSYVRKFTLTSSTNGVIYITPSTLPAGINLRVKLPGLTGWLNPLAPYMGGTPALDGDG